MKIQKLMAGVLFMTLLTGCAAEDKPVETEVQTEVETQVETETQTEEDTEVRLSQTEHLPELAAVIAETYDIPEDAWENTRYYYDYVDLNEDGVDEIFAVVMGMYTSGSGGDSALILHPAAGMTVSQQFTLVRMPILVSDEMTNGAHDLIFLRSGGGSEPAYVRLTCTDGIYSNPSDAEVLEDIDDIKGITILGNDVAADLDAGSALTLAGK